MLESRRVLGREQCPTEGASHVEHERCNSHVTTKSPWQGVLKAVAQQNANHGNCQAVAGSDARRLKTSLDQQMITDSDASTALTKSRPGRQTTTMQAVSIAAARRQGGVALKQPTLQISFAVFDGHVRGTFLPVA